MNTLPSFFLIYLKTSGKDNIRKVIYEFIKAENYDKRKI